MQLDAREFVRMPVQPLSAFTKLYEPGEEFAGRVYVVSDLDHPVGAHAAEVQVLDSKFGLLHRERMSMDNLESGPSTLLLGTLRWQIPASTPNQVALVCVSLKDNAGKLISRSVYPFWISTERVRLLTDVPPRRDHGPWLTEVKKSPTKLKIAPITKEISFSGDDYLPSGRERCASAVLEVANIGDKPAFHTGIEITNADCRYTCDDNYFMLMPGESKRVTFKIDRTIQPFYEYVKKELIEPVGSKLEFTATAWNAPAETAVIPVGK
jgi:hypothetical protein